MSTLTNTLSKWHLASWRVLALCAVFGASIAGTTVLTLQSNGVLFRQSQAVFLTLVLPLDPVVRFSETQIGQLLIPAEIGSSECRRLLFDNRTGASWAAGHAVCEKPSLAALVHETNRLTAMRRSFQK